MNYKEKIKDKMKDTGGIITSKALNEAGIPTIYLTRMEASGEITRVASGIYIDNSGDYDEYYIFYKRFGVAIFSYISALYLHGFTDILPNFMEITVYKGYNPHRMDGNVHIHYVTKPIYDLGITEVKTMFGNKVKVYDLERTICDLIKDREDIETELFSKTINRYVRSKEKKLNKLYEYSRIMKISDKVREIMEIVHE